MDADMDIKRYLPLVRKPSRYIGGEVNSVKKDLSSEVRLTFGLAFPDTYEIGMSHLGVQLLYQILNSIEGVACERVFAPWTDMEGLLRDKGMPLVTLESGIPLSALDVLGFSLSYELGYTNVLNMLDLGGVPLLSSLRGEADPIVIGGGGSVFNPEPVADFFDCFLLGDGEEAVVEIAETISAGKAKGLTRRELLEDLSKVVGVYVPSFFDVRYNPDGTVGEVAAISVSRAKVTRRIAADLDSLPLPTRPVVPFTAVHDRLSVEVTRGCVRGCRFCQAGMVTRPIRERSPAVVKRFVEEALKTTGYEEVGLLSLSTGDYTSIEPLLCSLMPVLEKDRIGVSLPSLRVGTLGAKLASEIKKVRKTGFTLAPEAASPRLRNVINKVIEDDDLIECAREVFSLGWSAMKLYFMVGLPTESESDVRAIAALSNRVRKAGRGLTRRPPRVNVSVSNFIPKPFTPFQWVSQAPESYCTERQGMIKRAAAKLGLGFKWHEPRMSEVEGVFSRGDRRLARVIKRAFEKGCRFDGWTDKFRFDLWQEAFKEESVSMEFYTGRTRARDEVFPWDHLGGGGVSKEFLYGEYERALEGAATPDCRTGPCTECGVCDHRVVKNRVYGAEGLGTVVKKRISAREYEQGGPGRAVPDLRPLRARLSFSKTGTVKFLGHLDLVKVFVRAARRGGLPIVYSRGHHPHPRFSFSQPLPVGIESLEEFLDIELERGCPGPERIREVFNSTLPRGLEVSGVKFIPLQLPSLSAMIRAQQYVIPLKDGPPGLNIDLKEIDGFVRDFLMMDSIPVHVERGNKSRDIDIRPLLTALSHTGDLTLALELKCVNGAGVRPDEVLSRMFNLSKQEASLIPIRKTGTVL